MENKLDALENHRNWLEVPSDAMLTILMKLGTLEALESAQFVCKLWYVLCKDPYMWRTIHIRNFEEPDLMIKHEKLMLDAVERSAAGLVDLSIEGFGTDKLFSYVVSRSSQLKYLRLACCTKISAKALKKALGKQSSLEELELTLCSFQDGKAIHIIDSCPSVITTFKLNNICPSSSYRACDEEAIAIAGSMPQLRHLQLIGNKMTDVGLTAILNGCPHLQSLDLRDCLHLDIEGSLLKRVIKQIQVFRGPEDSTKDYNYRSTNFDYDKPGESIENEDTDEDYGYDYDYAHSDDELNNYYNGDRY